MEYEKIPIKVDAVQLTWATWDEICEFVPKPWFVRGCYLGDNGQPLPEGQTSFRIGLILKTLESNEFVASQGDFIIKGINGEFYACKPDIFAKTYKRVHEISRVGHEPVIRKDGPAIEGHPIAVIRSIRESVR